MLKYFLLDCFSWLRFIGVLNLIMKKSKYDNQDFNQYSLNYRNSPVAGSDDNMSQSDTSATHKK